MISIEKAIISDISLGVPLGRLIFHPAMGEFRDADGPIPETFVLRGDQLASMQALHEKSDEAIASAVNEICRLADSCLGGPVPSVTGKSELRFSQDPHDYQSLAKYWWPQRDAEDRLVYVQRDGEVNPEAYDDCFDASRLVAFAEKAVLLAISGYICNRSDHAEQAARLVRAWFLDPATCQNPTFEFAQRVPDVERPKPTGIIEARYLIYVVDAIQILAALGTLRDSELMDLKRWFNALLDWLLNSDSGRAAKVSTNNIGFWYDAEVIAFARFSGRDHVADEFLFSVVPARLRQQMAVDGSLPAELSRTRPFDYVAFTLTAMALISRQGERAGIPVWDTASADGKNFSYAMEWLERSAEQERLRRRIADDNANSGDLENYLLLDVGARFRVLEHSIHRNDGMISRLELERDMLASERDALKSELDVLVSERDRLKAERGTAIRYANQLESRLRDIIEGRTWRTIEAFRNLERSFRGRRTEGMKLPKRPNSIVDQPDSD